MTTLNRSLKEILAAWISGAKINFPPVDNVRKETVPCRVNPYLRNLAHQSKP
jgi:hypothetical protein